MLGLAKSLNELLMDSGKQKPQYSDEDAKYVYYRDYPFSGAEYLTEENITETLFLDIFMPILEEKNENMWFEKRVNLWELVRTEGRKTGYQRMYKHPLQPDIDMLYGNIVDEKRQTPLTGVEVKLFSRYTGQLRGLIPKTTSYEGFYAGLDEAIALLGMGLEFVYLWHIKAFPLERLVTAKMKYGDKFFEEGTRESYTLENKEAKRCIP